MNSLVAPETKLPGVGTTIFTIMSQLARDYEAINLAQGFPDFPCSSELIDLVYKYMQAGCNQYAPMPGIMPLRERIAAKIQSLYNFTYNPDTEVTLTCGATESSYAAITSVVKPGDEVIVFEPAFDCYTPAIHLSGGIPVYIELSYPDYKIDWNLVKEKITPRTKLIIINSPHNPTGAIITREDIEGLKEVVKDTSITILSDEVYEHIVFDGQQHESVIKYPELRERSLVIFSFGKTFHTTGWRMGYCVAPAALSAEFRKVHQFITFSVPTPMQFALADYLQDENHYTNLPRFFQEKRDKLSELLIHSRFELIPSKGTYFQLASYKNISDENDVDFAIRLTKEYGVATIPVSVFYHTK
ncbi:MAG TPA: methionine aminotransferase, partial [Cytophagaceae bacterium]